MPSEIKREVTLEIVHVLFLDIVGYSKRLTDQQQSLIDQLNQVVRSSAVFQKAEGADRLIKIPTGDGMALIFYNSPEQPVECALEISRELKWFPELSVRMGVHSGPVSAVTDLMIAPTLRESASTSRSGSWIVATAGTSCSRSV